MEKKFLHKKYISIIVTLLLFGIAVSPSFNAIKITKSIDLISDNNTEEEAESLLINESVESKDNKNLIDDCNCHNNSQIKLYLEKICNFLPTALISIKLYKTFMSLFLHGTNNFNSEVNQITNKYLKSDKDFISLIDIIKNYDDEGFFTFYICFVLWSICLLLFIPIVFVNGLYESGYISQERYNMTMNRIISIMRVMYGLIEILDCPPIFGANHISSFSSTSEYQFKINILKKIYHPIAIG